MPRCSRLSSRIRSSSTNSIADVALVDAGRGERERAELLDLDRRSARAETDRVDPDHLDVEHGLRQARLRGAQLGRQPLRVLVVGGDDPPHELVADDVLLAEADELDALDPVEDLADDDEAGVLLARQVDLGDVAGDDHLRVEARAA